MANRSRYRALVRARRSNNWKVSFARRRTITRSATLFTAPKCKAVESTTRSIPPAISASAAIHRLISAASKPNAGPKNKTGNAPGPPGSLFTPRSLERSRLKDRHLLGDGGLSSSEARDRNSEGTATDVIQTEAMAEFHAVRLATMFAANPELDVFSRLASEIAGHFH